MNSFVNKTVDFAFCGARLRFELSHALFSSFDIDAGTRLLLKAVAHDTVLLKARRILDEGCGTGVIGLSIAAAFPDASFVMRDRDALAVAFTERNRALNKLRGASIAVRQGLLCDGLEGGPFDYVLSNVPAKAGTTVLEAFVRYCAAALLAPGGRLAFVIVQPLAASAREWCARAGFSCFREEEHKGHSIFICDAASVQNNVPLLAAAHDARPQNLALYQRSDTAFQLGRRLIKATGYAGLPEFDTVSFATELAIAAAEKAAAGCLVRDALFVEPGIGLAPLWALSVVGPNRLIIASRDLLAVEAAKTNLKNAVSASLQTRELIFISSLTLGDLPEAQTDLIIWYCDETPRFDWMSPAWAIAMRVLKSGSAAIFVASTTGAARMIKIAPKGMRILGEKRKKGFVALMCRRV